MTPTLFAGARPFFVARPLLAYISPAYPVGSSMASPVLTRKVSPGFMDTVASRHAYKSAPAENSEPYVGIIALGLSFFIFNSFV